LKNIYVFGIAVLLLLISLGCGQSVKHNQSPLQKVASVGLVVAGSGSNLALTKHLAAEYSRQSGKEIVVPGSIGTTGAIKAIREGVITLGLASRPLAAHEMEQGLKQIHYASLGLAVVVNPSTPETELDSHTLSKIYIGEKKTWSNGATIVALSMYEADSTNEALTKNVNGFLPALKTALAKNDWKVMYSDAAMLETLIKTPNSIGFVDSVALAEKSGQLKSLKFNGVAITNENIQTGKYPLKKELYFIYKETLSDEAKRFVDFCLSDAGRQVILSYAAAPVR
jgi:phosphate transport system substrate-binding protein